MVGAIATAIHYALLIGLTESSVLGPVWASALGYLVSSLVNYRLNYSLTFASEADHRVALSKFTIVATLGLALNSMLMYIAVHMLSLHYMLSQLVTTAIVFFFNYLLSRFWTYRHNRLS